MAISAYQPLLPALKLATDDKDHKFSDPFDGLANAFGLSAEEFCFYSNPKYRS